MWRPSETIFIVRPFAANPLVGYSDDWLGTERCQLKSTIMQAKYRCRKKAEVTAGEFKGMRRMWQNSCFRFRNKVSDEDGSVCRSFVMEKHRNDCTAHNFGLFFRIDSANTTGYIHKVLC
ncbi:hypothetical protein TNCV_4873601 [Trichonephila clavipes]|nr:hypothetical protein TNCV_4873601 [Trichonephila clavipes]